MVLDVGRPICLCLTGRPRRLKELGTLNQQVVVNCEALLVRLLANEHVECFGQVVVVSVDETVSLSQNCVWKAMEREYSPRALCR